MRPTLLALLAVLASACDSPTGGLLPSGSTPDATGSPAVVATRLTVGDGFACALLEGKGLRCWGANGAGQLGIGRKPADYDTAEAIEAWPQAVPGLTAVTALAAGTNHMCAQAGDETRCWGANAHGQLGNGKDGLLYGQGMQAAEYSPTVVLELKAATAVAAGDGFACARRSDGIVACWGQGDDGALGSGPAVTAAAKPVLVKMAPGATGLAAGDRHACAIKADGAVQCWGRNDQGQAVPPTGTAVWIPAAVPGLQGVQALAAGAAHTCALGGDGQVRCWGQGAAMAAVPGLGDVKALAAGRAHTCALEAAGGVRCWGDNAKGQLGVASGAPQTSPVAVPGVVAQAIAAGGDTTCAIDVAGAVWCWGDGAMGQLGRGTVVDTAGPAPVLWSQPTPVDTDAGGTTDGGGTDGGSLADTQADGDVAWADTIVSPPWDANADTSADSGDGGKVDCTSGLPIDGACVVPSLPVHIEGPVAAAPGKSPPAKAQVVVMWEVSAGSPDYIYLWGTGTASGTAWSMVLTPPLPEAALNAGVLGVGHILVFPAGVAVPTGKLDKATWLALQPQVLGAVEGHAMVYRKPGAELPKAGWWEAFSGLQCGKGVAGEPFDSLVPVPCDGLPVTIDELSALMLVNWT